MEFSNNEKLTILSVDPTDADEFLEIGMRKSQGEKLLTANDLEQFTGFVIKIVMMKLKVIIMHS